MKDIYIKEESLFLDIDPKQNADTNIKEIKQAVYSVKSQDIHINLCGSNMFDAIKISSLIAAYGLTDNTTRQFKIYADNKIVAGHIKLLGLSNLNVSLKNMQEHNLMVKI